MNRYQIYPSLLDAFQRYLDSELDAESFSNINAEGDYKLSADELADRRKQELLARINRVPFTNEAVERGKAFNALIDHSIGAWNKQIIVHYDEQLEIVEVIFNDKIWWFDSELCREVARGLHGATCQPYAEKVLDTKYGEVLLYGYADYIMQDRILDLKTTASYSFGKYERGWQRFVYPYIFSDLMQVRSFVYLPVLMREKLDNRINAPICVGTPYEEEYTCTENDTATLRNMVERFVEFLEANRDFITDKKIFGNNE